MSFLPHGHKEHNIALDIRDITDGTNRDDLITKGGKMQVPFFVDEKNNRSLYESQDIIDYLQQQH